MVSGKKDDHCLLTIYLAELKTLYYHVLLASDMLLA